MCASASRYLPLAGVATGQAGRGQGEKDDDVAFVPLAMPIMFGPGVIATILGMTSLVKQSEFEVAAFAGISAAIVATMAVTYLVLRSAKLVLALHRSPGDRRRHAHRRLLLFLPWEWA